jgi:hypothetical protein
MKKNCKIIYILIFLTKYFSTIDVFADFTEVAIKNQMDFLQKIISFEKNINTSTETEINIGVLYQSDNRLSNETAKKLSIFFQTKSIKIKNKSVNYIPVDISKMSINDAFKNNKGLSIVIVTQLKAVNFNEIRNFTTKNGILSFCTIAEIMEKNNFSIAFGYKGNTVQPIINPKQVLAEGFKFPVSVLEYSRIIK